MSSESLLDREDVTDSDLQELDDDSIRDLALHLQDRVEELEDQVEKHDQNHMPATEARVAMANLASAVTGRDIPGSNDMFQSTQLILDEFTNLREQVREHQEFIDSYGVEKPRDQDEAWKKVVDAARNKKNNPDNRIQGTNEVSLFIENLETATGFSDRHCSNLIEEFGEEKDGVRWIKYEPASAANDHNATKKQLVIDLDVWGDGE